MNSIFDSIIETVGSAGPQEFMICVLSALAAGIAISALYAYKNEHTGSFAVTIALLPAIVTVVIMVVSGDIGAGIAVAGAFSLVRFRSAPGSAKEIVVIFLSMATGLLMGMGYIAYAAIFAAIIGLSFLALTTLKFGCRGQDGESRLLKVTIPEDMDSDAISEKVIPEYADSCELIEVRSTNMGSMFRLTYRIRMKDASQIRKMIDNIRIYNGNLEVIVMHEETEKGGL